jgi:hypothetical protein
MMAGRATPSGRKSVVRVEKTRLDLLLSGELKIEDLDDEEINRQQLRNSQGDFRGRPPQWVPREFALAMQAEFRRRFQSKMQELMPLALKGHEELLRSRHLAPGDAARMSAIKEVYERTVGKVVQTSDVHMVVEQKSFEDFVGEAIIDVEEEPEDERSE